MTSVNDQYIDGDDQEKKAKARLEAYYAYWSLLDREVDDQSVKNLLTHIMRRNGHYDPFIAKCAEPKTIILSDKSGDFIEYGFKTGLLGRKRKTIVQTADAVELKEGELTDDIATFMVAQAIAGGMTVLNFSDCTDAERATLELAAKDANIPFALADGSIYQPTKDGYTADEMEDQITDAEWDEALRPDIENAMNSEPSQNTPNEGSVFDKEYHAFEEVDENDDTEQEASAEEPAQDPFADYHYTVPETPIMPETVAEKAKTLSKNIKKMTDLINKKNNEKIDFSTPEGKEKANENIDNTVKFASLLSYDNRVKRLGQLLIPQESTDLEKLDQILSKSLYAFDQTDEDQVIDEETLKQIKEEMVDFINSPEKELKNPAKNPPKTVENLQERTAAIIDKIEAMANTAQDLRHNANDRDDLKEKLEDVASPERLKGLNIQLGVLKDNVIPNENNRFDLDKIDHVITDLETKMTALDDWDVLNKDSVADFQERLINKNLVKTDHQQTVQKNKASPVQEETQPIAKDVVNPKVENKKQETSITTLVSASDRAQLMTKADEKLKHIGLIGDGARYLEGDEKTTLINANDRIREFEGILRDPKKILMEREKISSLLEDIDQATTKPHKKIDVIETIVRDIDNVTIYDVTDTAIDIDVLKDEIRAENSIIREEQKKLHERMKPILSKEKYFDDGTASLEERFIAYHAHANKEIDAFIDRLEEKTDRDEITQALINTRKYHEEIKKHNKNDRTKYDVDPDFFNQLYGFAQNSAKQEQNEPNIIEENKDDMVAQSGVGIKKKTATAPNIE